jgi:preprotein translocase subunit SecA
VADQAAKVMRFYLSMEDPLLKIFAGDRLKAIMDRLKLPDGEAIEAGMVTRSIESAQRKVEARNFDIRKQLLEYDDVSNEQRKIIYGDRNAFLETADMTERVTQLRHAVFTDLFRLHVPADAIEEQWDVPGLEKVLEADWQLAVPLTQQLKDNPEMTDDALLESLLAAADKHYDEKVNIVGKEAFGGFERSVLLQTIDQNWREHLSALDHLRQGIHLRGYAQKNPKQEYKRESFELFQLMQQRVRSEAFRLLMTVKIQSAEQIEQVEEQMENNYSNVSYTHADFDTAAAPDSDDPEAMALAALNAPAQKSDQKSEQPFMRYGDKIGRNDPCPCGSGKKYKQCHGTLK